MTAPPAPDAMPDAMPDVRAPSALLLLLEARVLAEWALAWAGRGRLAGLPRGDGHPVVIVPGFGASDAATLPLRKVLGSLGYAAHGWELGRNIGMRPQVKEAMRLQLERLHAHHRQKVSLIGWSLGGVYVRELARHHPQRVRRVITLGSPINQRPDANNLMGLFRLMNRGKPIKLDLEGFRKRIPPPPVPCTAIYSRSDGLVAWRSCLECDAPNTDNVEVSGTHLGMVANPAVIRAIAERLAIPEDGARS